MIAATPPADALRVRLEQYERIIAAFRHSNETLRRRRTQASPVLVEHCDRHIALNERTIATMERGMDAVRRQMEMVAED